MGHIGLCPPDDASGRKSLSHITPSHHTVRSNGHITSLSDCIYATPGNVANRSTTVTSVSWRPPVAPSGESKPHYMPTALRLWINRLLCRHCSAARNPIYFLPLPHPKSEDNVESTNSGQTKSQTSNAGHSKPRPAIRISNQFVPKPSGMTLEPKPIYCSIFVTERLSTGKE